MITGGRTRKLILDPPVGRVDVLVCSFGVISKLSTLGVYNLKSIRFVVLDEADALFHHTFEDKLRVFMKRLSVRRRETVQQREYLSEHVLIIFVYLFRLDNIKSLRKMSFLQHLNLF